MSGADLWRGAANAWDCDEFEHVNVRYYMARLLDGLVGLQCLLGMTTGGSILSPVRHHVRFLREVRAGQAIHLTGGVVSVEANEAVVTQTLIHSHSGHPAAAFTSRVAHATASELRPFPWTDRVRARLEANRLERPDHALPRSVPDLDDPAPFYDRDSLKPSYLAVVASAETDVHHRLRDDALMGRFSDAAGQVFDPSAYDTPFRMGVAALETRIVRRAPAPRLGRQVAIRSGPAELTEKVERLVHEATGADDGEPLYSAELVAACFDLDRRRIVPFPESYREARATGLARRLGG